MEWQKLLDNIVQLPVVAHVLILQKPPASRSFLTGSFPAPLTSLEDARSKLNTALEKLSLAQRQTK